MLCILAHALFSPAGPLRRRSPRTLSACVLLALSLLGTNNTSASEPVITVFAAVSLTDVLPQISKIFVAQTGIEVRHSFAASSTLARQIENGARVDIFLSADETWMDHLQSRSLIKLHSRRNLLGNQLVLIQPAAASKQRAASSAPPVRIRSAQDLAPLLSSLADRRARLSIADPVGVPLGRYSQAALESLHAWHRVRGRLATADHARTAMVWVARGESPLGIVYRTDALEERRVTIIGIFDQALHPRIVYPVAATRDASADARRYLDFLGSESAAAVFRAKGFEVLAGEP